MAGMAWNKAQYFHNTFSCRRSGHILRRHPDCGWICYWRAHTRTDQTQAWSLDRCLCCHSCSLLWLSGNITLLSGLLNVPLSVSYFCDPNLLLHEAKNNQAVHPGIVKCNRHLCCCVHSGWHLWLPHLWLQCGRRHSLKLLGHWAPSHGGPHCHGCQDLHLLSHIALLWQVWVSIPVPSFVLICSQGRTGLFAQGLGAEGRKCWEVGKGEMSHDLPWTPWGLIDYIVYHIGIILGS